MTRIQGLPPLLGASPRVLILGSMPGSQSLQEQTYYAHPRNAFWPIMGELLAAGPALPYLERTRRLTAARIAVWDVLASCNRQGSLDSAINRSTAVANDLLPLLQRLESLRWVFFNGQTAALLYHRRVLAEAGRVRPDLQYQVLPSTSPAMAQLDFTAKLERWRCVALAAAGEPFSVTARQGA